MGFVGVIMCLFNLSLDDFSPHPKAGINFEAIEWCDKLIQKYPNVKIDLFVPAAYARLGEKPRYLIDNLDWVKKVKDLPSKNYRINLHGLFHRRIDGKHPDSNNDEFQFLNEEMTKTIMKAIVSEFNAVGLKYEKVFRPPAWKISLSAAKELTRQGYVIAGNEEYYNMLRNKTNSLKWISYNWDLNKECIIKAGSIFAYGHTSTWTTNFFGESKYEFVCDLLDSRDFDFIFLSEL